MTRIIALTGGTGFVGRRVIARLAGTGVALRLLVRDPSRLGDVPEDAEVITGDLADHAALQRLVEGADAVIHIAGAITAPDRATFDRINVAGTAALAHIAARAGVARFVQLSSMAAREPRLSDYGASKLAGEVALADNAGTMSWVILRPPAVYGPGDRATLPLIAQLTRRHAFLPGTAHNRTSLIHVDDLADAVIAMASGTASEGTIHELHDGRPDGYSWQDLARQAGSVQGIAVRVHHLPKVLLLAIARIAAFYSAITGKPAMLTPGKVRELYHPDWVARHNLLEDHSAWRPQVDFATGVAGTLDWYRRHQWLPGGGGAARSHNQSDHSETTT